MLLKELSELNGISGREDEVRNFIRERIKDQVDEITVDAMGNLIALRGKGLEGPKVMLAAHMDEVGLMVLGIDGSGLLKVGAVGGIDHRILVSKPVLVGEKRVLGVIGAKPIHLQEKEERRKPIPLKALFVDIGAKDKGEAEKLVKVGDAVCFATEAGLFGDNKFKGKALDDRVGCAVLMNLLSLEPEFPVYYVFTVQEEVGLRGAEVAAYGIKPDLGLVFEGTSAGDVPEFKEHQASTRVGAGPAITFMDRSVMVNKKIIDRLVETAKTAGIPYQFRQMTTGGTEAGAISLAQEGAPAGTLSVPCRYIHSPVSVMSMDDFHHTIKLAGEFLKTLKQDFSF